MIGTPARRRCALNRHLDEDMELRIELRGLGTARRLDQALTLWHRDLQATNHRGAPDAVVPRDNPHVRVDGEKFHHYMMIPSLQNYVLVSQDEAKIEVFRRPERGRWGAWRGTRWRDTGHRRSDDPCGGRVSTRGVRLFRATRW